MITANGHIVSSCNPASKNCLCGFVYQSYVMPIETPTSKCVKCNQVYKAILTKGRKNLRLMYGGWELHNNANVVIVNPKTRETLPVSTSIRNLLIGQRLIENTARHSNKYTISEKGIKHIKEYYRI